MVLRLPEHAVAVLLELHKLVKTPTRFGLTPGNVLVSAPQTERWNDGATEPRSQNERRNDGATEPKTKDAAQTTSKFTSKSEARASPGKDPEGTTEK